jgi:hypothetical protein
VNDAELGKQADKPGMGKITRKLFIADQARKSYDRGTSDRPGDSITR